MIIVLLITALGRQRQEDALELKVYLTYIVKGAEKYIHWKEKKKKSSQHITTKQYHASRILYSRTPIQAVILRSQK